MIMNAPITAISTPLTEELPPAAGAASTRLRLTRRGRIVFGVLAGALAALVFVCIAMFSGSQAVANSEVGDAEFGYVVVQPGDSLWQVASEIDPSVDPRDLVAEIIRLNQLPSSDVQAGDAVAVPLRYADALGVVTASDLAL